MLDPTGSTGQPVPCTANLVPVLTDNINLMDNDDMNTKPISLRSLLKEGRYLVINFGSCT
jgi:hypothetical protein